MLPLFAAGLVMAYGYLTDTHIPVWVLGLVFLAVRFVPLVLGGSMKVGEPAAPLNDSVVMVNGERPSPGTEGKVVVVERWATWCPPCVKTIPHLNKLYEKYKNNDDVQFIGVTDEEIGKVKAFAAKHNIQYPIGIDTQGIVAKGYPSQGIPNATIIGKNGRVFWNGHPMQMDDALVEAVAGGTKGGKEKS